ncbi:class I SAM-dependent methyltransferase [bacterium]|nr:class I SAM-dependent methyltransferase [bacterium]
MGHTPREPQTHRSLQLRNANGLTRLGLHSNQSWQDDPKHLAFSLSRYKFVAKMLSGRRNVLEVGCGDAFGTRIVLADVQRLTAIDFEPLFVSDVNQRMDEEWRFDCFNHDITDGSVAGEFDAAFSLDVIEHIPKEQELDFMSNLCHSVTGEAAVIIGTPSRQSQVYASEASKLGHVNCKDHNELRALMARFFQNIFLFSMNDEVVHTGFYPMAHYLLALCCSKRPSAEWSREGE